MSGRPFAALITVRCTAPGCLCERSEPAQLYETRDSGQLLERTFTRDCPGCGHATNGHATVSVEKQEPIERRSLPR